MENELPTHIAEHDNGTYTFKGHFDQRVLDHAKGLRDKGVVLNITEENVTEDAIESQELKTDGR